MFATAVFDHRRLYRYRLTRTWDEGLPAVTWIMLNPSTADEHEDDPTITRVVAFSRAWGFGSAQVVNLFALRTSSPADLRLAVDPVGPGNDEAIEQAVCGDIVVTAWGNHGAIPNPVTREPRSEEVWRLLAASGADIGWLRTTAAGQPGHPLYVRGDTRLVVC